MKRFIDISLVLFTLMVGFVIGRSLNWSSWYSDNLMASASLRLNSATPVEKSFFLDFNLPGSPRTIKIFPTNTDPFKQQPLNVELELELFDQSGKSLEMQRLGPTSENWTFPFREHIRSGTIRVKVLKSIPAGPDLVVGVLGYK